jgi:hypothetical protein
MKTIYRGFELEAFRDWNMLYTEKFIFTSAVRISDGLDLGGEAYPPEMKVKDVLKDMKIGIDDFNEDNYIDE